MPFLLETTLFGNKSTTQLSNIVAMHVWVLPNFIALKKIMECSSYNFFTKKRKRKKEYLLCLEIGHKHLVSSKHKLALIATVVNQPLVWSGRLRGRQFCQTFCQWGIYLMLWHPVFRWLHSKPQDKVISMKNVYVVYRTCKKRKTFFIILCKKVLGYVQFSNNYHFILYSHGKYM